MNNAVMSTDFHRLPESEWSAKDLEVGYRMVCKRNEDDLRLLDVFVQFKKPIEYITIDCDLSF